MFSYRFRDPKSSEWLKLKEYSVIFTTSFYGMNQEINPKSLFPKFQLIPNLRFQVMHDYVCFIVPIDYCVEISLVHETFCEN